MSREKILVVEDDKHIARLVQYNLNKAGFECAITETGEEALSLLETQPFDLIILDIMLPRMDGLEVCKQIKQRAKLASLPIVMLTARGEEIDRIVGFELGADDYVVKPFSPLELALRIKAILKRKAKSGEAENELLTAGRLTVDISRHRASVNSHEVELTALEFKLLATLMRRRGIVQSRRKLLEDIWDIASDVTTRTVDTHIKRLRQKLGEAGYLIETVRSVGYRFSEKD